MPALCADGHRQVHKDIIGGEVVLSKNADLQFQSASELRLGQAVIRLSGCSPCLTEQCLNRGLISSAANFDGERPDRANEVRFFAIRPRQVRKSKQTTQRWIGGGRTFGYTENRILNPCQNDNRPAIAALPTGERQHVERAVFRQPTWFAFKSLIDKIALAARCEHLGQTSTLAADEREGQAAAFNTRALKDNI